MLTEITQNQIKAATTFWARKVDACTNLALTSPGFDAKSAALALAGRYAEAFLSEIQLLIANDEVMQP